MKTRLFEHVNVLENYGYSLKYENNEFCFWGGERVERGGGVIME